MAASLFPWTCPVSTNTFRLLGFDGFVRLNLHRLRTVQACKLRLPVDKATGLHSTPEVSCPQFRSTRWISRLEATLAVTFVLMVVISLRCVSSQNYWATHSPVPNEAVWG